MCEFSIAQVQPQMPVRTSSAHYGNPFRLVASSFSFFVFCTLSYRYTQFYYAGSIKTNLYTVKMLNETIKNNNNNIIHAAYSIDL